MEIQRMLNCSGVCSMPRVAIVRHMAATTGRESGGAPGRGCRELAFIWCE